MPQTRSNKENWELAFTPSLGRQFNKKRQLTSEELEPSMFYRPDVATPLTPLPVSIYLNKLMASLLTLPVAPRSQHRHQLSSSDAGGGLAALLLHSHRVCQW